MSSLLSTWTALSLQKKAILAAAVVATIVATMMLARLAAQPGMALLYGGLDPKATGEVVAALEQLGVQTEVRGDSVYVPASERDRVRVALAKDGLPAQGQAGYELLDTLSGFGTTTEMFQAAYWRAKEGELARTILAVPGVRTVRVHIGTQARRPFERAAGRSTASVTVTTSGGPLTESAALSIRYLVALAAPGIETSDVAVIDARHGVILKPGDDATTGLGSGEGERRGEALRAEIEQLLAVRVGQDNVRVSVTVETTTESRTVSERILDPDSQVTRSSENAETVETSTEPASPVTVASNLPDGDAAAGQGGQSSREETRESVNYEYSETRRDAVIRPGAVKRIGVAVLVDQAETTAPDGTVSRTPRTAEELDAIEQLVKSAIAFDADRGDVVTVESMPFADEGPKGAVAEASAFDRLLDENLGTLVQLAILGVVAILLGLFVVRPILTQRPEDEAEAVEGAVARLEATGRAAALGADGAPAALNADGSLAALDGAAPTAALGAPTAGAPVAIGPAGMLGDPAAAEMYGEDGGETEGAVSKTKLELLREVVAEKPDETVVLLKRWLNLSAVADEDKAA